MRTSRQQFHLNFPRAITFLRNVDHLDHFPSGASYHLQITFVATCFRSNNPVRLRKLLAYFLVSSALVGEHVGLDRIKCVPIFLAWRLSLMEKVLLFVALDLSSTKSDHMVASGFRGDDAPRGTTPHAT